MTPTTISLIGIAITLIAYLCVGFYWAGKVSAKLDQLAVLLAKMDDDTAKRLDTYEAENEKTHALLWAKHDDLKNRMTAVETRCEANHK